MSHAYASRTATARRARQVLVAGALTVLVTASGVAWGDLAPVTGRSPDPAPVTATPAPITPAVPGAVTTQQDPAPVAGSATSLLCTTSGGLPVCTHDDAHSVSGVDAGASAPAVPVTCAGDGRSGNRVQVLYVRASDQPDRFSQVLPALRRYTDVANGVFSRSSDGRRQLRVVTDRSCSTDVQSVAVTPAQAASFVDTTQALRATGYARVDRKYLLFVDNDRGCGLAEQFHDDQPGIGNRSNDGNMFAAVYRRCWGGVLASHEVTHMLGGVQPSAPRSTGGYGHCTDQYDVMCYPDGSGRSMTAPCGAAHASLLDCGRDDYFSLAPAPGSYLATRWNVASSSFLVGGGAPRPTAPSPPTSVTSSRTADQVTLRWDRPEQSRSGVSAYDLVDLEAAGAVLATVEGGAVAGTVRLTPWRTYRLAVVARNGVGSSAPAGNEAHMVGSAPGAPTAVMTAYSVQGLDLRVQLVWPAVARATEYVVHRDGRRIGVTASTSWSDADRLPPGKVVRYTVSAVNPWGTSPPSQTVRAAHL